MPSEERDFAFIRKLGREIEHWVDESLVSPEQKDRILARYAALATAEEKAGPGKLITTITVLGSILVGVGVLLFVASNWSQVPRWGKLSLIFSSLIASYAIGYYLRYEKQNYPRLGASLILLGSLIFGAGIFLIAQIYHISVHYPNGPLLWGLAVLPLAYLLRFRSILALAIIDLLIWLGVESSFRIAVFASFGSITIMTALFFMAGLTLWALGLMHRGVSALRDIAGPYLMIGMFTALFAGYLMTFDILRGAFGSGELLWFYLGLAAMCFASVVASFLSKDRPAGWFPELLGLCVLMVLMAGLALAQRTDNGVPYVRVVYEGSGRMATLAANLVYFCAIIGIIVLGYLRHHRGYVNIGLLFFVLDVIARYFDLLWRLLPRSLFFIGGGALLLAGGVLLEKKRRKVLATFGSAGDPA